MKQYLTLVLLRGIPGSGKTSLAQMLSSTSTVTSGYVCADDYFTDADGNYNWDPSRVKEAHLWCQDQTRAFLTEHWDGSEFDMQTLYVHNTSTTEAEVEVYRKLAEEAGAKFISLIVENRHGGKNTHNVPEEALKRMEDRFSVQLSYGNPRRLSGSPSEASREATDRYRSE